jgi:hypothetical protein
MEDSGVVGAVERGGVRWERRGWVSGAEVGGRPTRRGWAGAGGAGGLAGGRVG